MSLETSALVQAQALGWLALTLLLFYGARRLHQRVPRLWLSPIILTPTVLISALLLTSTPYEVYALQTRWLTWMPTSRNARRTIGASPGTPSFCIG